MPPFSDAKPQGVSHVPFLDQMLSEGMLMQGRSPEVYGNPYMRPPHIEQNTDASQDFRPLVTQIAKLFQQLGLRQ